jgi:ABC-type multidrug transport system ATPase subunit
MTTSTKTGYTEVELGVEVGKTETDGQASKTPVPDMARSASTSKHQDMKWSNICFRVGEKKILQDCWGDVPNGRLMAIMGPSGSGKSSLLNVLAGRSTSIASADIEVRGRVEVGGFEVDPVKFRKNIAYVMQEDALMATATPREALMFSALLRLPDETTKETITKLVNSLLEELGITECADTMIGNILIKGISGGQKKRTSVGVEMITEPSLLFLDEPTSGLDSFAAFNLVKLLKTVATDGAAVLCTIHQPSSEVFHIFDQVIFLKEGRILYNGPVHDIVAHLGKFDYQCPEQYNPSDYVMMLCQTESAEEFEKKGVYMQMPNGHASPGKEMVFSEGEDIETKASFLRQVWFLTAREFSHTIRDVGSLIGRFGVTIFLHILFSLIFKDAGDRDDGDEDNFNSHYGALTMVSISTMFGSAQPTLLQFPFERPLFLREYSTGTYGAKSYFISKAFIELPLVFFQTLAAWSLVWNIIGFQGPFILMVIVSWGLGIAAASLGVLVGCLVPDVKKAAELMPLLFVPQILFAGFFIRIELIPVFLRWVQYLCSLKYAMNILLLLEFDPTSDHCSGDARSKCEGALDANDVIKEQWWVYALILAVLFLGFRIISVFVLVQKAKTFY